MKSSRLLTAQSKDLCSTRSLRSGTSVPNSWHQARTSLRQHSLKALIFPQIFTVLPPSKLRTPQNTTMISQRGLTANRHLTRSPMRNLLRSPARRFESGSSMYPDGRMAAKKQAEATGGVLLSTPQIKNLLQLARRCPSHRGSVPNAGSAEHRGC